MNFSCDRAGLRAALSLLLLLLPGTASAGLKYDLRVTGGGTSAIVTANGQVISIDLFAVVTGAAGNAAPEGFQNGFGSISSSTGGNIKGNLSATLADPFNANGATVGKVQDLDGDGDMDVGSILNSSTPDLLFARASSMQTQATGGTPITDGVEFKLATLSFTVTSVASFADFSPITVAFRVPAFSQPLEISALWKVDGTAQNSNGVGGGTAPTVGSSVLIEVPEPTGVALLSVAALALIARRRPARAASPPDELPAPARV